MNQQTMELTRKSLHGIAEFVLAGPQYAQSQDIRLGVTPGGFGTVNEPQLRVDGLELVGPGIQLPLTGTFAALARAAGVEARDLRDVYAQGPAAGLDDAIAVDPDACDLILRGFAIGDAAMRTFAPDQERVLWPEHFDIGITLNEVNYGVSPGDAHIPVPYAYVGPWAPRRGDFWNASFGASRLLTEVADVEALVAFFSEGKEQAAAEQPVR